MRLSAVGCELESGAFNVILGRNGAGKTRLCRRLAGLDADASVLLDGRAMSHRDSSMVFQEFVNYPSLTVHDNIASPMRARREKRGDIAARVGELARTLGLGELLARRPAELSGGQQQRVAIARALAKNARVLVLDEPLGNLDYKLRESLASELKALLSGNDRVLVYTTADPHEALALADHLLLLDGGRVLQAGAPLDVWCAPTNRVAADLLSDPGVNFSPAYSANGALRLNDTVDIAVRGNAVLPPAAFLLGARPEHLRLARYRDSDICFAARVSLSETNGSDTFLHVEVAGLPWVAHVDGIVRPAPGTPLDLYLSAADLLTFELGD